MGTVAPVLPNQSLVSSVDSVVLDPTCNNQQQTESRTMERNGGRNRLQPQVTSQYPIHAKFWEMNKFSFLSIADGATDTFKVKLKI